MRIHMREGDELVIDLPGGSTASIAIIAPEDEGCLPELDIMLPTRSVANCWIEGFAPGVPLQDQPWSVECVQICIPIQATGEDE